MIHAALPRAKIILIQRHPLDACWAIYKAHFQGKFPFSYHQIELAEYYSGVSPAGAALEVDAAAARAAGSELRGHRERSGGGRAAA